MFEKGGKRYAFGAGLVWKQVKIWTIIVWNRVWFQGNRRERSIAFLAEWVLFHSFDYRRLPTVIGDVYFIFYLVFSFFFIFCRPPSAIRRPSSAVRRPHLRFTESPDNTRNTYEMSLKIFCFCLNNHTWFKSCGTNFLCISII